MTAAVRPETSDIKSGEEYHVFLSYRSVNRIWVLNLDDVLRQQGFEVFLAFAHLADHPRS
jgi:hypothetical protein